MTDLAPGVVCHAVGYGRRLYRLTEFVTEPTGVGWRAVEVDRTGRRVGGEHAFHVHLLKAVK